MAKGRKRRRRYPDTAKLRAALFRARRRRKRRIV